MKQLWGEWFFEQGSNNVLQIMIFHDRNKVNNITTETVYNENIIINKYNNTDKKVKIVIPSNQLLTSYVKN